MIETHVHNKVVNFLFKDGQRSAFPDTYGV